MSEIQDYIEKIKISHGDSVKRFLDELHQYLKVLIPGSNECISYSMPCLKLNNKPVVYFAAYKTHIGFYPTAKPIAHFKDKLHLYKHSKGAIQFPINQPLPTELIKEIIEFKVNSL
jgi:uncharacterized protein YdhG (YjbR/CyaY superfamily)